MKKITLLFLLIANCLLLTAYCFSQGTWTQKANFSGGNRVVAVSFSIGCYGYLGTGYDGTNSYNDFWEFSPLTNAWTQKANVGARAGIEPANL